MKHKSKLARCYRYWGLLLLLLPLFAFSMPNSAQAGATSGLNNTAQNALGDVLGATAGGSTNSILPIPTPTPSTLPSVGDITSGINSGLFLPGLQGDPAMASIVGNIIAMFDDLPAALQATFLEALLSSDLIPSEITDLINQFQQLQNVFDTLSNMSCGGGTGLTQQSLSTFAQNSLASMIDPSSLFSFSGSGGLNISVDINIDPAGFANEAMSGLATSICPGAASILPGGASTDPSAVPTPGGPPAVNTSPCESNYQSARSSLPSLPLGQNTDNIREHIRAAASELGMDPSTLAGVIWLESRGGDKNATANSSGCPECSATGLIQWLNATATGLGMHGSMSRDQHIAYVRSLSVAEQMEWVVAYYNSCGWQAGMNDYQAYSCVHAGSPGGNATDGASGYSTDTTFNNYVLPKIEAFRCQPGGFDWNAMDWTVDNGATL